MIDSILNALKSFFESVLSFISSIVNAVLGYLSAIITGFYDFIVSIPSKIYECIVWVRNETLAALYEIIKSSMSAAGVSVPSTLPNDIYYWYHQINVFMPVDYILDITVILIDTWLAVVFIRVLIKIKIRAGGIITKGMFKT